MSALKRRGKVSENCAYRANQHVRLIEGVRHDNYEFDDVPFERFAKYLVNLCLCILIGFSSIMEYVLLRLVESYSLFLGINIANFIVCLLAYTVVWMYRIPLTLLLGYFPGRFGQLVCTLYWSHELADELEAGGSISVACESFSSIPALRKSKHLLDHLVWSVRQGYTDVEGASFAEAPDALRSCLRDGFLTGFLPDYLYTCSKDLLNECTSAVSRAMGSVVKVILVLIIVFLFIIILTPRHWSFLLM